MDIDAVEELEDLVNENPELKELVNESISPLKEKKTGTAVAITRVTGAEVAALWSLGLLTLLVLRRLGLLGGSRVAQAKDTARAAEKLAEAVDTLMQSGYEKEAATKVVNAMYRNADERKENEAFLKALKFDL